MDEQTTTEEVREKRKYTKRQPEDNAEMVSMPRSELDEILKRLERVENPGIIQKPKRSEEHFASMRVWEDELVIGIGKAEDDWKRGEQDVMKYMLPVKTQTVDGIIADKKVPYLPFLHTAPRVKVQIMKSTRLERVAVEEKDGGGGIVNKAGVDDEGRYSDTRTDEELPLTVTYVDLEAEIVVKEGAFEGTRLLIPAERMTALNV